MEGGQGVGHPVGRRAGSDRFDDPGALGRLGQGAGLGGQLHDRGQGGRVEHLGPGRGHRQRAALELVEETDRVDLERGRVGQPLEAVGRDVVRAVDRQPPVGVADGQPEDRPDDLAEHRAEVGAGVLGVVDLGAETGLADREPAGHRRGRHPDVDPELARVVVPVVEREVVPDEVAAHPEVAADRLPDPVPVERPGEGVGDRVRDRAVELVARVERGDVVVAALEDRSGQELDPLRDDRAQVGVDDHERLHLEGGGHLEDRPQGGALAADPLDLGVGQGHPLQAVRRADQEDPLDVVGGLRLGHDPLGAVGRAGVGVDQHRAEVGEVLDQPGLGRPDHVADRRRVPVAGDADHDVGAADPLDLVADRLSQDGLGHPPTVPPRGASGAAGRPGGGGRSQPLRPIRAGRPRAAGCPVPG